MVLLRLRNAKNRILQVFSLFVSNVLLTHVDLFCFRSVVLPPPCFQETLAPIPNSRVACHHPFTSLFVASGVQCDSHAKLY